jgi:hypothetical protein
MLTASIVVVSVGGLILIVMVPPTKQVGVQVAVPKVGLTVAETLKIVSAAEGNTPIEEKTVASSIVRTTGYGNIGFRRMG